MSNRFGRWATYITRGISMTYVMSVGVTACWAEWLTPVIRWKDHTEQPVEAQG